MSPSRWRLGLQLLLVRLRFPLVLLGVLLLFAGWPTLSNYWDRLTRAAGGIDASVSSDTEYWCPMCPGVLSEWPAKCPVCHMALVRRKKGEATPLPDGVIARMQLSPYRVQLAGIRTAPAEYRPLVWEVTLGCLLGGDSPGRATATVEVPETDVAPLRRGLQSKVECEAFPGQSFPGAVRDIAAAVDPRARSLRVTVDVEDPDGRLRPGMYVTVRFAVPLPLLESAARQALDDWRDRTAVDLAMRSPAGALTTLIDAAGRLALRERGLTLSVLASSVIDTGERKVVFVESMPGLFDAVEVTLGRRCGDYYPVIRGVEAGQAVVSAGAFLLDAETRLKPSLAAAYFGAAGKAARTIDSAPQDSSTAAEDEKLIARQKVCPVMDEPLGSMGPPVRVVLEGRTVFLCCKGCEGALRREPKKYLAKLPAK